MNRIYFDGGARPNPGIMEIGVVVEGGERHRKRIGHGTNNLAEWNALLWAIEISKSLGWTEFEVCGDSQLVCYQAIGRYKIKKADLLPFKAKFDLAVAGLNVKIVWLRREINHAGWMLEG